LCQRYRVGSASKVFCFLLPTGSSVMCSALLNHASIGTAEMFRGKGSLVVLALEWISCCCGFRMEVIGGEYSGDRLVRIA
jgi:hypothetical protein